MRAIGLNDALELWWLIELRNLSRKMKTLIIYPYRYAMPNMVSKWCLIISAVWRRPFFWTIGRYFFFLYLDLSSCQSPQPHGRVVETKWNWGWLSTATTRAIIETKLKYTDDLNIQMWGRQQVINRDQNGVGRFSLENMAEKGTLHK